MSRIKNLELIISISAAFFLSQRPSGIFDRIHNHYFRSFLLLGFLLVQLRCLSRCLIPLFQSVVIKSLVGSLYFFIQGLISGTLWHLASNIYFVTFGLQLRVFPSDWRCWPLVFFVLFIEQLIYYELRYLLALNIIVVVALSTYLCLPFRKNRLMLLIQLTEETFLNFLEFRH